MPPLAGADVSRNRRRRRRAGSALAVAATTILVAAPQFVLLKTASMDKKILVPQREADAPNGAKSARKLSDRVRPSRNQVRIGGSLTNGKRRAGNEGAQSKGGKREGEGKIPHILYFTYKHNVLTTKEPIHIYDNVMHTIADYRRLWGEPEAPVVFLDDDMCREKISATEPRLLQWFNAEPLGMYKADICRVSALYLTGGLYFDVDLRVYEPVALSTNTTFSSSREATIYMNCDGKCPEALKFKLGAHPYGKNNLFQAFLATSPGHPVLKLAFQKMLDYYERRLDLHGGLGVSTLGDALAELTPSLESGSVRLLEEIKNEPHMTVYYPELPEQEGTGTGCRKIVHDPTDRKVYFYSRIPGVDKSCVSTKFNTTYPDKVVPLQ